MEARRVLLVLPWGLRHVGGVNQVVEHLGMGLNALDGWQARLLVTGPETAEDRAFVSPLEVVTLPLPGPFDGSSRLRAAVSFVVRLPGRLWALRGILARGDYGIVNVHFPSLAALHFVVLRWLAHASPSLVLSFHLTDAVHADATSGLERRLWHLLLGAADAIVLPTGDLAVPLERIHPGISAKVRVIANGVDVHRMTDPTPPPAPLSLALEGRRVLLSVGAFQPRKGHGDVMRALVQLAPRFPGLALVIVGTDHAYRSELERLRDDLGLARDVFFYWNLPHERLPAFYQRAELFVLATAAETFCIAILEAGAAGVPVITTHAPGVVEVVTDGETALMCPVGDVKALATAIARLLEHPDEAQALAGRLGEKVRRGLTWTHHRARYTDLYRSLKPGPARDGAPNASA